MSYTKYEDFLKKVGTPRTDVEGGEITLIKSDAIKALELLRGTDVAVLGGDVHGLESDGYFRPLYDNWCCNKEEKSKTAFAIESQEIAYKYLTNYNENQKTNIRYVLVVEEDYEKFSTEILNDRKNTKER